jgi:hypothetical protein
MLLPEKHGLPKFQKFQQEVPPEHQVVAARVTLLWIRLCPSVTYLRVRIEGIFFLCVRTTSVR